MKRRAGILLHISSLPGNGPIGDFGPEAYRFVDYLKGAGQKYWQMLPLNPVNRENAYSPYNPFSAFAGNTLFINEELLVQEHLLKKAIRWKKVSPDRRVHYNKAEKFKQEILETAYAAFKSGVNEDLNEKYERFCKNEAYWLKDYALFMALKHHFGFKSWNNWPEEYCRRKDNALHKAIGDYVLPVEKEKFAQFLFHLQWNRLKKYAHKQGIKIFGDVPIYIGYDSADVWKNPQNFLLEEDMSMARIAGVPPDYFNKDGQLWNMPVYNWEFIKQTGYRWWIDRIRRNLELFDLVRLDHFRGFSAYWEVDASEKTAKNGQWTEGPGNELFEVLKKEFPKMPFAAEDLGDIDKAVYRLRDNFDLPGMRVLQFGFGDDWPNSLHLPHNYSKSSIVYTGTHDNNTVKGWYTKDINRKTRKYIKRYAGSGLKKPNIHYKFIRLAYASIAKTVIIPMQDILGLGSKARMNFPSTVSGNWTWRMTRKQLKKKQARKLHDLVYTYGRGG